MIPSHPSLLIRETLIVRVTLVLLGGLSLLFFLIFFLSGESLRPSVQRALLMAAVVMACLSVLGGVFQTDLARTLKAVIEDAREQLKLLGAALRSWSFLYSDGKTLAGLMLVGILLRGLFVTQPIRTDEAVTYLHYASRSLPLALSNYSAPNNHLLHTFFAWISVHVFGNTEIALRLPALLMGILLILVTYGVGRVLANRQAGLLAAGLVSVSSVLIEYSTNARGYTLQCVLFGLSILIASKTRHSLSPTRWGLLALVLALGFYTVPTMLYPFGGLMLWLLAEIALDVKQTRHASSLALFRAWVLCGILTVGLTLVFYIPVLIVSGPNAIIANQYVQPFAFDVFLDHLPDAAAKLWAHWHISIPPLIAAVLSIGALIGLVRGGRTRIPLLIPCMLWSLSALCIQRVMPFERSWMPFLSLYLVTAAAALVWLWDCWSKRQAWIGWLLATLLIGGLGANIIVTRSPYVSIETGTFRDAKAVVQDLQSLLQPGDRVGSEHPSRDSLAYYASQMGLDWAAYEEGTGDLYFVLNTEYPQTLESVAWWNGVALERYTATTIRTYPQGALVKLELKPD